MDGNNSSRNPLERVRLVNITSHEQVRDTGVGRMPVSGLPESRWETSYAHIVMERHQALISSPVFRGIRRSWLRTFSRRTPFASVDEWTRFAASWLDEHEQHRRQLETDAALLAARFAVPTWHILPSLFINGYRPESGQTPLDLRYPRTSIVISGPASELFDSLHQPAIDRDIQVIWEPFRGIEDQAEVGHQALGVVELPLDMPMAEAVRLTRRSLRAIKYTMKQVGASLCGPPNGAPHIRAHLAYHGSDDDLLGKIILAAGSEGMPVAREAGVDLDQEAPGWTANPLSYLSTRIRFSPDVRSVDLVLATRAGVKAGRAVCRALGVDVGQRVRSAPLVQLSSTLGIEGTRLPDRGLGDLVLSQLRGFPRESGRSTDEANKMMSTVKSRRNQVLDRFRKKGLY